MEKLEAKLKAVDWAVRDVLVGTMRSPQQLDICWKHCFYYIPAERLQDSDFPVRYVALYQSQYVFGAQAGVRYYGEVMKCSAVRRRAITAVSPRRATGKRCRLKLFAKNENLGLHLDQRSGIISTLQFGG